MTASESTFRLKAALKPLRLGAGCAVFCVALNCFGPLASAQSVYSEAYTFTTFAGTPKTGSADGVGTDAQFNTPSGVAVDSGGNVYVADTGNNTIREVTSEGLVTTLAGIAGYSGDQDGTGSAARFVQPHGVAVDNAGNIYVADTLNSAIREITPAGVVTTLAGPFGGSSGMETNAGFDSPYGVAVDNAGNIYVADTYNSTIREITPVFGGTEWEVTTIAGLAGQTGSSDGTNSEARFNNPYDVAVDSATNLYVADTYSHTIRKITPIGGIWKVTTLAGQAGNPGTIDGTGSAARFFDPYGLAVDSAGNVYVADTYNSTVRKITPAGVVTTLAGVAGSEGNVDGTGSEALFNEPASVAVDSATNVYVADQYNDTIRMISPAGVVTTVAGVAVSAGSANGTGAEARFDEPYGVATATNGDVYVADTDNSTIRKINTAGVASTIAGLAGNTGSADGAGSEARFNNPHGVAADSAGNVYVADYANNTVRKVTSAGVVTTLAGLAGFNGSDDGTGSGARFYHPYGVAVDSAGNVYVADNANNTIRKVTPAEVVTTLAGTAGNFGTNDGMGPAAKFSGPEGMAVDAASNVYVADSGNSTIRMVTPAGVVTTLAGVANSFGANDGPGAEAQFEGPGGVAVDSATNLYVADTYNSTIRKITPVGSNWMVSTIAGNAAAFDRYSFANGAGISVRFYTPAGLAVDNAGNLYVADTANNAIRKGVFSPYTPAQAVPITQPANTGSLVVTLFPPEANGQWRFPWELSWRDSGQAANNLVEGEYPIEFRNLPGYLILPLVSLVNGATTVTNEVAVTDGVTTFVTNEYYPTITTVDTNEDGGSLTINIGPSPPNGAGWRFLGETNSFFPPDSSTNLTAGTYLIEFAPVAGFTTPSSLSVQVVAGFPTVLTVTYLLASAPPAGVLLPTPVPAGEISDLNDYPYGFNGQLQTDVGYGSGVAVETNVVLTAAHLIFNDQTLSYVSHAYWFAHEEAGVFAPEPLQAQGWYVLSGYASQRTNDVIGGLGPDQSSPQSRNLDVAALYFNIGVADGGEGGYLPSDATPNSWLTGTAEKMLTGYPVDGSQFGFTNIVNGQMYEIGPQPYPLSLATDPVADQQVYTASWMLSYPGNSGGPFYVQFDGVYYPAAVYLGTLFNGVTPYASAVRAIDSNVVNLINAAAALGYSGTNFSGGGVINVTPGADIASNPGLVEVTIAPPAAAQDGGAWKLSSLPDAYYSTQNPSTLAVTSTNAEQLVFKQIAGWNSPAGQSVTVEAGNVTELTNTYTLAVSWAAPASITYGTSLGANQLDAVTVAPLGNYTYTPSAGVVLDAGTNTLSVVFTPGDTLDYGSASASANVSLVVMPAPLNATAFDAAWVIGQPFPVFNGVITGVTNDDNITATFMCSATTNSPPGTYAIVPSFVDPSDRQTNYIVNLVNGTLTISPAPVTNVTPPVIQSTTQSVGSFSFTWSGAANQNYEIQATADLTQGVWTTLTTGNTGANTTMTISEPIDANGQQFYRVVVVP